MGPEVMVNIVVIGYIVEHNLLFLTFYFQM